MNLAGFRNCLEEYTVHSLSPRYGLFSALVLLNSVARWCNTTQFFTKMVSFYMLVCMGVERNFSRGWPLVNFKVFLREAKSSEICFSPLEIKKTAFLLKFSNSCPSSDTHLLVCRKRSCHTIKKLPFKKYLLKHNSYWTECF